MITQTILLYKPTQIKYFELNSSQYMSWSNEYRVLGLKLHRTQTLTRIQERGHSGGESVSWFPWCRDLQMSTAAWLIFDNWLAKYLNTHRSFGRSWFRSLAEVWFARVYMLLSAKAVQSNTSVLRARGPSLCSPPQVTRQVMRLRIVWTISSTVTHVGAAKNMTLFTVLLKVPWRYRVF